MTAETSQAKTISGLSEELRFSCQPVWDEVVYHRFTKELAADTLSDAVMRRYLIQDYAFLDSFVRLVASAVVKAPTLQSRIPLCQFLGIVTSDENTYFQRAFAALNVPEAEWANPTLAPATRGFLSLMDDAIAAGTYGETLAPLVVFEWSYLSWASAVADRDPGRFYLKEWITLHANPDFEQFVGWLRAELDRHGPALPEVRLNALKALFRRAVDLEKAFFDAAYGETSPQA